MEPDQVPGYTISIHALLAESDATLPEVEKTMVLFLSTLSLRRATFRAQTLVSLFWTFLSTLSLRRATRGAANCYLDNIISIHALLAESDHFDNYNLHCVDISIHALLAESDTIRL